MAKARPLPMGLCSKEKIMVLVLKKKLETFLLMGKWMYMSVTDLFWYTVHYSSRVR